MKTCSVIRIAVTVAGLAPAVGFTVHGCMLSDVVAVLGSLNIIAAELDR